VNCRVIVAAVHNRRRPAAPRHNTRAIATRTTAPLASGFRHRRPITHDSRSPPQLPVNDHDTRAPGVRQRTRSGSYPHHNHQADQIRQATHHTPNQHAPACPPDHTTNAARLNPQHGDSRPSDEASADTLPRHGEGVADHLTATAPAKAGRPTTGHNRSSTCHGMMKVSRLVTDPATAPQLYQHPTGSRTHPQPDPVETSPTPAPALITYTSFDHTSSSTTCPPDHTTNAARLNPHIGDSRPSDATSEPQD